MKKRAYGTQVIQFALNCRLLIRNLCEKTRNQELVGQRGFASLSRNQTQERYSVVKTAEALVRSKARSESDERSAVPFVRSMQIQGDGTPLEDSLRA